MGIWMPVIAAAVTVAGTVINLLLQRHFAKKDKTADRISHLQSTLDTHIAEDAEHDAKQARRRIIGFADECRRGTRHSEEHFDNVLEDVDAYNKYCAAHPEFENSKAVQSIRFITDVYDRCKRTNDFI